MRFACTLTIRDCESKRLRASASLRVETSGFYHHGQVVLGMQVI